LSPSRRHRWPLHRTRGKACRHLQRAPTRTLDRLHIICVTTLSEHVGLQADQEQVLCRELVCVCDELQSGCEHVASALTVHPRVQTLLLTRPSALLQTGTTSEWMCWENMEQQMQQERRAILELPVVSGISHAAHGKRCGFRVNLKGHTAQEHGNCECGGLKQGVSVLVSST